MTEDLTEPVRVALVIGGPPVHRGVRILAHPESAAAHIHVVLPVPGTERDSGELQGIDQLGTISWFCRKRIPPNSAIRCGAPGGTSDQMRLPRRTEASKTATDGFEGAAAPAPAQHLTPGDFSVVTTLLGILGHGSSTPILKLRGQFRAPLSQQGMQPANLTMLTTLVEGTPSNSGSRWDDDWPGTAGRRGRQDPQLSRSTRNYQVSMQERFFPDLTGGGGQARNVSTTRRRVVAGSMTSSISNTLATFSAFPCW